MKLNFEKIPFLSATALVIGLIPLCYLCLDLDLYWPQANYEASPLQSTVSTKKQPIRTDFELPLATTPSVLSAKTVSSQMAFSLDPPRPSLSSDHSRILIRLPQAKQNKRVTLPAKVGLEFNPFQTLEFREQEEQFWLQCNLSATGQVEASLFLKTPTGKVICKESWVSQPQETPLLSAEEISKSSPFRILSEARWWGHDLFAEKFKGSAATQRIEIGPHDAQNFLDLQHDQWLVYKDEQWQRGSPQEAFPIAHILNQSALGLEIEGWEDSSHIRLKIPPILSIPLKTKGEELFSQLRIRSDKQVSCVIDKQCLILRPGDWVLKTPKRWKVLRKKEDREAFLAGNITGDLFVFDRIDTKNSVKSICGQLFSVKRSQVAAIECAQATKNSAGTSITTPKAAGKPR